MPSDTFAAGIEAAARVAEADALANLTKSDELRQSTDSVDVEYSVAFHRKHSTGKSIAAAIRSLTPTASDTDTTIPGGWKLVPIEPTKAMVLAGGGWNIPKSDMKRAYAAMLAASPKPDTDTPVDPSVEGMDAEES